jgi:WD40 repeat protein
VIANHRRMLLVVLLLLATSMLACEVSVDFGGGTAETPTQPPVSMATLPNWPLVVTDDFSDPESGFSRDSDENGRYFYRDGYYGIEILKEDWSNWTWRGDIFSDFMLEVDVTSQREAGQGGVIFRQVGEQQFYGFAITPDGRYRLQKRVSEDRWETLLDWQESPHIRTGLATNRLGVVCEGSTISLYVNGQDLDSVQDTTYTEGKIGLTAGTFEEETHTLFHFDNLRIYATAPMVEASATPMPPVTATPVLEVTATPISPATATPVLEVTATPIPPAMATPAPPPTATPIRAGRIAFTSLRDGNNEIYVMNADGSGVTRLTNNPAIEYAPAGSLDGRSIAFMSRRDGNFEIYVMNADGSGQTRLTNSTADDWDPAWSPDGRRIAFASYVGGNNEIFVMNADGSGVTRLTNNTANDLEPCWSFDGTRIVFVSSRAGNNEIYVMNADGSGVTRLTNNSANDGQPSWSPTGRIVFASTRDGNDEIYTMNADGSGLTRLTNHSASDYEPCWSPDGRRIAFTSYRDGNQEIYVMNADGSGLTRLTNNSVDDWDCSWFPG